MFFELEDVKRRHNPTWWTDNVTAWVTTPDSTYSWNYKRGAVIGLIGQMAQGYYSNYLLHMNALLKHYQHPIGLKQSLNFFKSVIELDSFKQKLGNRMQFAITRALLYCAPLWACFRTFNSGWSSNFGVVEFNYYRKIPTVALAAFLTSPISVTLEMAQRAYQAELSFPANLRKGYTSFLNALLRIPFEEGPYYLQKNTLPLYLKNLFGPFTAIYSYDFLIDKAIVFERISDLPHGMSVAVSAIISSCIAALISYPMSHSVRECVDFWPKKGGKDPFEGNYRKAFATMWFSETNDYFAGFFRLYFWHYAPKWVVTLAVADTLGMFKYWRISTIGGVGDNSYEDSLV